MGYEIYIKDIYNANHKFTNVTQEVLLKDIHNNIEEYADRYAEEIDPNADITEVEKTLIKIISEETTIVSDSFHILKNRYISDDVILDVYKYCPNTCVIYFNDLKTYALSNTSVRMYYLPEIELAYYLIDGVSPKKVFPLSCLSDESKDLLKRFRSQNEK